MAPAKLKRRGWGDVEAAPLPLHDVVVADDALMDEAADAIQLLGSGPPSGLRVSRRASQAAVVIGHEAAQGLISRSQVRGPGQTQFADEPILEHAPETFDTTLGLGRVG